MCNCQNCDIEDKDAVNQLEAEIRDYQKRLRVKEREVDALHLLFGIFNDLYYERDHNCDDCEWLIEKYVKLLTKIENGEI